MGIRVRHELERALRKVQIEADKQKRQAEERVEGKLQKREEYPSRREWVQIQKHLIYLFEHAEDYRDQHSMHVVLSQGDTLLLCDRDEHGQLQQVLRVIFTNGRPGTFTFVADTDSKEQKTQYGFNSYYWHTRGARAKLRNILYTRFWVFR